MNAQKPDPTPLIIKINFMLLGLFVVGYGIFTLRNNGSPEWLQTLVGTDQASSITLCDTRIVGLIKPNQYRISQNGRKWIKEGSSTVELNFLDMERWFGANCKVSASNIAPHHTKELIKPIYLFKFVDGAALPIYQGPDGSYIWKNQSFRSTKLDAALQELDRIGGSPL